MVKCPVWLCFSVKVYHKQLVATYNYMLGSTLLFSLWLGLFALGFFVVVVVFFGWGGGGGAGWPHLQHPEVFGIGIKPTPQQ